MTDIVKLELENNEKRTEAMQNGNFAEWASYYFPEFFPKKLVHTVLISADLPENFEKLHLVSVLAFDDKQAAIHAKNWLLNDLIIKHPYLSDLIDIESFKVIKTCMPVKHCIDPKN